MKLAVACDHRGYDGKRRLIPLLKKLGHDCREVWIVDRRVARRAVVDHFVSLTLEQRNHSLLQVISAVITGDRDFHRRIQGTGGRAQGKNTRS